MTKANSKANAPAATFRLGNVSATIWANDNFHNVVLARSFKDDAGNWKQTDSLAPGDIQSAREVLQKACDWLMAK